MVVVTAGATASEVEACMAKGCSAVLAKPVRLNALKEVVDARLPLFPEPQDAVVPPTLYHTDLFSCDPVTPDLQPSPATPSVRRSARIRARETARVGGGTQWR
jgi:CheY-like chemotaxis protein